MKWFKIDGREWDVKIFEPKESFTILYSENTGRTLSEGAPMVLDPLGTFFNYSLTVGKNKNKPEEFDALWDYISKPRKSPMLVVLPRNQCVWHTADDEGNDIEGFFAYVSNGERGIKTIQENIDGTLKFVDYDTFTMNIIATKAQVIPSE